MAADDTADFVAVGEHTVAGTLAVECSHLGRYAADAEAGKGVVRDLAHDLVDATAGASILVGEHLVVVVAEQGMNCSGIGLAVVDVDSAAGVAVGNIVAGTCVGAAGAAHWHCAGAAEPENGRVPVFFVLQSNSVGAQEAVAALVVAGVRSG